MSVILLILAIYFLCRISKTFEQLLINIIMSVFAVVQAPLLFGFYLYKIRKWKAVWSFVAGLVAAVLYYGVFIWFITR